MKHTWTMPRYHKCPLLRKNTLFGIALQYSFWHFFTYCSVGEEEDNRTINLLLRICNCIYTTLHTYWATYLWLVIPKEIYMKGL